MDNLGTVLKETLTMASPSFTLSTTSATYPDVSVTVTNTGGDLATWSSSDTSVATITTGETDAPTITFVGYGTVSYTHLTLPTICSV